MREPKNKMTKKVIAISADQSTTPTPFNGVNVAQWSASELMNSKQSLKIVDSSIINPDWSPVYNVSRLHFLSLSHFFFLIT